MWQDFTSFHHPLVSFQSRHIVKSSSVTQGRVAGVGGAESGLPSVGLGPLAAGGAPGGAVPDGRGAGQGGMALPEHGVAGLWGAGEGARAVVQRGLVLGGRGQEDGAGLASLQGIAARGGASRPRPVVPAVLPQAVWRAGATRARWQRGGARGPRCRHPGDRVVVVLVVLVGVVVVLLHVV